MSFTPTFNRGTDGLGHFTWVTLLRYPDGLIYH